MVAQHCLSLYCVTEITDGHSACFESDFASEDNFSACCLFAVVKQALNLIRQRMFSFITSYRDWEGDCTVA